MSKDLYEILEIEKTATEAEIKQAYKKLVRIYHPDINKNENSILQFKLLNNAYEVLSDKNKRKNYDDLLKLSKKPVFENSIIKVVKITENEAKNGAFRTVNILNTQKCPKCYGKKFINGIKCAFCLGHGEKSEHRKIEVEIKKGTKNGDFIYVDKLNKEALYSKELFLEVIIEKELDYFIEGQNKIFNIQIPLYDAILGIEKEINIKDYGIKTLIIPPLTKPNTRLKLNSNYYAQIEVVFPKNISNEEKNLYDKIREVNLRKQNAS